MNAFTQTKLNHILVCTEVHHTFDDLPISYNMGAGEQTYYVMGAECYYYVDCDESGPYNYDIKFISDMVIFNEDGDDFTIKKNSKHYYKICKAIRLVAKNCPSILKDFF